MTSSDLLDLALGPDGDLVVGDDGGFAMASGPTGVAQLCKIAIRLLLGEWFRNRAKGIDWFGIFQERFDEERVNSAVRTVLLAVPGVVGVRSIESSTDSERRGSVVAVVQAQFGDVTVTASVGGSSD